uniref:Uncharacterized protein n=1 Tax=Anguilla anguilla TaxID=7936 RepID=A0A0E9WVI0_ANGAN
MCSLIPQLYFVSAQVSSLTLYLKKQRLVLWFDSSSILRRHPRRNSPLFLLTGRGKALAFSQPCFPHLPVLYFSRVTARRKQYCAAIEDDSRI